MSGGQVLSESIPLKIEFGGGLELLFSNQRSHRISVPLWVPSKPSSSEISNKSFAGESEKKHVDVDYLICYLRDELLKERPELFVENGTIRPGILVLINDSDWELEGEGSYQLQPGDEIVFISTLHGG